MGIFHPSRGADASQTDLKVIETELTIPKKNGHKKANQQIKNRKDGITPAPVFLGWDLHQLDSKRRFGKQNGGEIKLYHPLP